MAGLVLPRKERKALRREEAIERNTAYKEKTSTIQGIRDYINFTYGTIKRIKPIGAKQLGKLEAKLIHMEHQKNKKKKSS